MIIIDKILYLGIKVALGPVLADDKRLWFVDSATRFGELPNFDFVRITLFGSNVDTERRVGDVLIVELDAHTVFTCSAESNTTK